MDEFVCDFERTEEKKIVTQNNHEVQCFLMLETLACLRAIKGDRIQCTYKGQINNYIFCGNEAARTSVPSTKWQLEFEKKS